MKTIVKHLVIFLFVMLLASAFTVSIFANTVDYTEVSNYATSAYFTFDTDKDALTDYSVGEKMTFTVKLNKNADTLVSVPFFKCTLKCDDGTKKVSYIDGKDGMFKYTASTSYPGKVELSVYPYDAEYNKIEGPYIIGGAFADYEKIEMEMAEPEDFDEYWDSAIAELEAVAPEIISIEKVDSLCKNGIDVYAVYIECAGSKKFLNTAASGEEPNGATYVAGYMGVPQNAKPGSLGLVVTYQGAGVFNSPGNPANSSDKNNVRLNIFAHSIELGREDSYYNSLNSGLLNRYTKRITYNDDVSDNYFRYMLMRASQAVRFLKLYFGEGSNVGSTSDVDTSKWSGLWNETKISVTGDSQGGFQALGAAALNHDITSCSAGVPGWCNLCGEYIVSTRTTFNIKYPGYYTKYYDSCSLAKRIVCQTTITTGTGDTTCPAIGPIAAYNALNCPKKLVVYQGSEHGTTTKYTNSNVNRPCFTVFSNARVNFGDSYTYDWEIESIEGDALTFSGNTVTAVKVGSAVVSFKESGRPDIKVDVVPAKLNYAAVIGGEGMDELFLSMREAYYDREGETLVSFGVSYEADIAKAVADFKAIYASDISAGNYTEGKVIFFFVDDGTELQATKTDIKTAFEASSAEFGGLITDFTAEHISDISDLSAAMYALNLDSEIPLYVVDNTGKNDYSQIGRNAIFNLMAIVKEDTFILDDEIRAFNCDTDTEIGDVYAPYDGLEKAICIIPTYLPYIREGIDFVPTNEGFKVNEKEFLFAKAYEASGASDDLSWVIDDGTLYVYAKGDISSSPWSVYSSEIERIEIAKGASDILSGSFSGMSSLREIHLPYTVKSISDGAFGVSGDVDVYGYENNDATVSFCDKIGAKFVSVGAAGMASTNLEWELKDGVLTFSGTAVTVDSGISEFGPANNSPWYDYYNSITKIVLIDSITSISAYCFYGMKQLKEVQISEKLNSIEDGAFMGCQSLCSVYYKGNEPIVGEFDLTGLKNISQYSFDGGAKKATVIKLSEDFDGSIGYQAFKSSGVVSLVIPKNTDSIAKWSFGGTSALKSVTFLGEYTTINSLAFTVMPEIIYGRAGSTAERFALANGIEFRDLTGDKYDGEVIARGDCGENVYWKIVGNTLYIYGNGTDIVSGNTEDKVNAPWASYASSVKEVVFRGNISSMGEYTLSGLTSLQNVIFEGNSITEIGKNSFYGCTLSERFTVPESVTSISSGAFDGVGGLEEIVVESMTLTISDDAFASPVTVFAHYGSSAKAFADGNSHNFKNINEIIDIAKGKLYHKDEWSHVDASWEYHKSTKTLYLKSVSGYSTGNSSHALYASEGDTAFAQWKNEIEHVILSGYIQDITKDIFKGYTALKTVDLGGAQKIYSNAFSGCTSLVSVYNNGNIAAYGVADLTKLIHINSGAFDGAVFDTIVTDRSIAAGCFADGMIKTVIGKTEGTVAAAENLSAGYVFGGYEEGSLWSFENGTLTLYASGTPRLLPGWADYSDDITKIIFGRGCEIASLCKGVFDGFANLGSVLFRCDAPESADSFVFGAGSVVVYYSEGADGFEPPMWNGYTCMPDGSDIYVKYSGICCDGGYGWAIDSTGTLFISGSGNGVLSFNDALIPWQQYADEIIKIEIKEETAITSLYNQAFSGLSNLKTVIIPTTLTKIEEAHVFANAPKLSSFGTTVKDGIIDLSGMISISSTAFEGSMKNAVIYMPENAVIGENAFDSSVTLAVYPSASSEVYAYENGYAYHYYTAEENASLNAAWKSSNAFTITEWTVPDTAGSATDSTTNWKFDLSTGVVTTTGGSGDGFQYSAGRSAGFVSFLTTFKYKIKTVQIIGGWFDMIGFSATDMPELQRVEVKNGNSYVSGYWQFFKFENCPKLTTIGEYGKVTEGVVDLTFITKRLRTDAPTLGSSLFINCPSITEIRLPRVNFTSIPEDMIIGCDGLELITIPSNYTTIADGAFDRASKLRTVTLEAMPSVNANTFPDKEGFYVVCSCAEDASYINSLGYEYTRAVYYDGEVNPAITAEGFNVRLKNYNGLRSIYSFDNVKALENENDGYILVEYGAIVASKQNFEVYGKSLTLFDGEYVTANKSVKKAAVYSNGQFVGKLLSNDEKETRFALTVVNFTDNFMSDIYFGAYEIWRKADGTDTIIYTDYSGTEHEVTNIYRVSLDMYKYGVINGEDDEEGIVWSVLRNGAATVDSGKYTVSANFSGGFKALEIKLTANESIDYTLLDDNGKYMLVLRGSGAVPKLSQLYSSGWSEKALSDGTVPNPVFKSDVWKNIGSIVIDHGITSTAKSAFLVSDYVNTYATSVIYPMGFTGFGNSAFSYSTKMSTVLQKGMAFEEGLADVSPLTSVDTYWLFNKNPIKKIHLPSNVTSIKDAFNNENSSLLGVWAGDGEYKEGVIDLGNTSVSSIAMIAFRGCTKITTVILPSTCKSITGTAEKPDSAAFARIKTLTIIQQSIASGVQSFVNIFNSLDGYSYTLKNQTN